MSTPKSIDEFFLEQEMEKFKPDKDIPISYEKKKKEPQLSAWDIIKHYINIFSLSYLKY